MSDETEPRNRENSKESPQETPLNAESVRNIIKKAVAKLGGQYSKEEKLEQAKALIKIFEKGMSPREAMNISDKELGEIYSFGYQLFSSGKIVEARELFKMLLTLEPREAGFALGLGSCHHHLKKYEEALNAYMLASALAPEDPVPLFFAYECYVQLKDLPAAGIMLSNVIAKAGDIEKYKKIKERAITLLENIEKEILTKQK